jgi:PAS domain S-box-containing protein
LKPISDSPEDGTTNHSLRKGLIFRVIKFTLKHIVKQCYPKCIFLKGFSTSNPPKLKSPGPFKDIIKVEKLKLITISNFFKNLTRSRNHIYTLSSMLALLVIGGVGYHAVKSEVQKEVHNALDSTLAATLHTLEIWTEDKKLEAQVLAAHPEIRKNILTLIKLSDSKNVSGESLKQSRELKWLRENLGAACRKYGFVGFVLFDNTGLQVGALLEKPVGIRQLTGLSDFYYRSMQGDTVLSHPFASETPLPDINGNWHASFPTMFASTPIRNDDGTIVGVLGLRIRPETNFSRILDFGNIGKTGETYLFNRDGILLSFSRFELQLRQAGLIPDQPDSHAILNIEIRDPGVDLIEGLSPGLPRKQQPFTLMAASAIKGGRGFNVEGYNDYRGIPVVGAWQWVPKFDFAIATEMDAEEAFKPLRSLTLWFGLLFGLLGLSLFVALVLRQRKFQVEIARNQALKEKEEKETYLMELEKHGRVIREKEAHLRAILDNAIDGIITINERGIVQSFNPAAEHIFGYKPSEVLGQNVKVLMPEPYRSEHDGYLSNYIKTGQEKIINIGREVIGLRKDGSTFPMDLGVTKMWLGEKQMFIGTVRDLTQRKREEALTTRLGRILDESVNEIYVFDASTLKFTQVNAGARKNMGYSLEELSQMTSYDIKPHSREKFEAMLEPLRRNEKPLIIFQSEHIRKDKTKYPVEVRLQLMDHENPPVFVAIVQDITEQKQAEEELQKTHQQLLHSEKLNAAGKLSASFAHEFNNPLTGVRSALEQIRERVPMSDDYKELLDVGIKESNRMAGLVRKLADSHRPTAGTKEPLEIHELINEILLLKGNDLRKKNIRVDKFYSPDVPKLEGISDQLKQVMLNLVQNAGDAIPLKGGEISLSTASLNGSVEINVKDTGSGIAPEKINSIFDPFFTTKGPNNGSGLGLSVSHGIIKSHNGNIRVKSKQGEGTTFTVTLPINGEKK